MLLDSSVRLCEHCTAPILITSKNAGNANRFCSYAHYWKYKRTVHLSLAVRLLRKLSRGEGCWEWTGYRDPNGYGRMGGIEPKSVILTHRASWQIHFGPIPEGMDVCHKCDNPPCGRPDHLFIATHQGNMQDASAKGRTTQGERAHGARLTTEHVIAIRQRFTAGVRPSALAREYGVAPRTIRDLLNRETWQHVS